MQIPLCHKPPNCMTSAKTLHLKIIKADCKCLKIHLENHLSLLSHLPLQKRNLRPSHKFAYSHTRVQFRVIKPIQGSFHIVFCLSSLGLGFLVFKANLQACVLLVWAVIDRMVGLNNKHLFLTAWDTRNPRSRPQQIYCLVRELFLFATDCFLFVSSQS